MLTALGYARRHGVRTVLDIDYRPVLWGLTSLGAPKEVSPHSTGR